jgi:hypothetical protein
VGRAEQWTYRPWDAKQVWVEVDPDALRDAGLDVAEGDLVTLTVEPEHMTGDWLVLLSANIGTRCW